MTEPIILTRSGTTATLILNRPEQRNALTLEAMAQFAHAIDQIAADGSSRALIVTGQGTEAFCSGADLLEMSQKNTEADAAHMIGLMGAALRALERLPIPTFAAINGYALGGGAELALACDFRIIDFDGRIGFIQAKRGVIPGWGGGQRLMRLVGYAQALDILLSARLLSADESFSIGLVGCIAPSGEAVGAAETWAASFARLDPAVVRALKAGLQAGWTQRYDDALQTERALFPPLWASETRQQATQAFLNKQDK
jgi:enoyl-CoA hydratase/carnithine racemase